MTSLVIALTAAVLVPQAAGQGADRQKEVLVLFSTRRDAPIARVVDRELPRLLDDGLTEGLDYYSEYLDSARFSQPDYPAAFRDFLRLKYADHRFDVVLLVGDVVTDFVMTHRERLFPDTPMVFYSPSPVTGRVANSTGLVNQFRFSRSLDLAMALQPDLKHIYVVSGAAATDHMYESQARSQFVPFERQLELTYLSGLRTKDLEARLKTLPPHSAVFVVIVTKDGDGQNFQQMDYLSRVASVANAPTYSWADVAVDAGIVGGHRRDQVAEARALARLVLRVIRGERADDIPVSSPNTDVDHVDWRQLRRWGISEGHVPSGTRVAFRELSAWDRYKGYFIGSVTLMLVQAILIVGLLVQSSRLRRTGFQLRESQDQLRTSYDRIRDLGSRLLGAQESERARIARELHDDINQQVAVLSIELDLLRADPQRGDRDHRLSEALERARRISMSVRELSHRLHPTRLQTLGLVAAIDSLQRDFARPRLSIAFSHRDVPAVIEPAIGLCVFRAVQEALNNAIKHSGASHVWIDVTVGRAALVLTVADNGNGFNVDCAWSRGLGLTSLRERVEAVGGVLQIVSTPRSGSRLSIEVPVRATSTAAAERNAFAGRGPQSTSVVIDAAS